MNIQIQLRSSACGAKSESKINIKMVFPDSQYNIIRGWLILIQLHAIQSELLAGVLNTVGNDVGDLVNGVTGDSKATHFCRMNSVIRSVTDMV